MDEAAQKAWRQKLEAASNDSSNKKADLERLERLRALNAYS